MPRPLGRGKFTVSHASIANILSSYGIAIFSYTIATTGIENTTCIIEAPTQIYALRIYRQAKKSMIAIKHEIAFMQKLRVQGLPIPEVYANQAGKMVTQFSLDGKNWEALLMEFTHGNHPVAYSPRLLDQMAQAQAKMHMLGKEFAKAERPSSEISELVEGEFVKHINMNEINDTQLLKYIERIRNYRVTLSANLPCAYSHFDFDAGNILIDPQDNLRAILDFDDLQYAPLAVCLSYTLWSILYETASQKLVNRYLAEYQKVRKITDLERKYLPKIIRFRHYAITALNILNGHTSREDINYYEKLERQITRLDLS